MKIAILGFGREGKSLLRFLKKSPKFRGAAIKILDKKLDKNYLKNLGRFDIVFRSPGVPYNLPTLKVARKAGVKFSSATALFFENCPAKIIGITGTKGKGTTSTLLCKILSTKGGSASGGQAGKKVFLAGNIGKPALDILLKLKRDSLVILELSSFQLQDLKTSPDIAVLLDIFPDHLDAHENLKEYFEAKRAIAKYQNREDSLFFFKDNAGSRRLAQISSGHKIAVDHEKFTLFSQADLKIAGLHNFRNAVMASTVALKLGVSSRIVLRVVKNFRGLEHRLEFIRKIDEVKFYNDSASTNPQTTAAAIRAFPYEPKVLIAGGQDKNLDYQPLARAIKHSNTNIVILFGKNKKKIERAIKNSSVPIKITSNLKTALAIAYKSAVKLLTTHYSLPTNIIFSPGSASFDMFKNYEDRGEQFKKLVKRL